MYTAKQEFTKGNVHTLSYFTPTSIHLPNASVGGMVSRPEQTQRKRKRGTLFIMNPHKGSRGECNSIKALKENLQFCADALHMPGLPELTRIDFKVDYIRLDDNYTKWLKLGDWAVLCFCTKKKVRRKNEGRNDSNLAYEHQSTYGRTDGYEVVNYNKALQKKSEGVGYRFEIRHKIRSSQSEVDALKQIRELVLSLPAYSEKTISTKNKKLIDEWNATAPIKGTPRVVNEFIRAHMDEIYTREQLKQLYIALGYEESAERQSASKAVRNFLYGNPRMELVTEQELTVFCEHVAYQIDCYISDAEM